MLGRVSSLDWLISIGLLPLSFALTGPVSALLGAQGPPHPSAPGARLHSSRGAFADVSLVTPSNIGTLDFARNPAARASRKPWLEHWLETCRDLSELRATHPMMDAVIDEVDGRMIRVGDHWLADFASCNYLGFDLDREIIDAIPAYLDAWGTHPSWSRLLGSPVLYEEIEDAADRAARLRGLARPADDHAHPHVRDPAARGLGDDLPRRARAQDDLRRLPGRPLARRRGPPLPLRGSRPSRRAAAAPSPTAPGSCAWTASTA